MTGNNQKFKKFHIETSIPTAALEGLQYEISANEENQSKKQTLRDSRQYLSEKTYDNRLPAENEVIAPFVVTWEQVKADRMDPNNLKTWTLRGGRKVLVAFTVCQEEAYSNMMRIFNYMADGHVDTAEEDHLSLDELIEDMLDPEKQGQEPAGSASAEDEFFATDILEELIDVVSGINPRAGEIIRMLANEETKGDILNKLNLKKSQGYATIQAAQETARRCWDHCF